MKQRLCGAAAALVCLLSAPAPAADTAVWPASEITPPTLSGRVMIDAAVFDNDDRGDPNISGTQLRRARIGAEGELHGFDYEIELEFADDLVEAKSVYLARELGPGRLVLGQQYIYFSLSEATSSKYTPLMERAFLAESLAPFFKMGASYRGRGGHGLYSYQAAFYNLDDNDQGTAQGTGTALRGTLAPWHQAGKTLHLGLSFIDERYGSQSGNSKQIYSVSQRSAGRLSENSKASLWRFANDENVTVNKYALELATVLGPWSLQGEYGGAVADDGVEEGELQSGYVLGSWFITGESRVYDAKLGRFGRLIPKSRNGAWELVARYQTIAADQGPSGEASRSDLAIDSFNLGVNWYFNPYARLMVNLIDAEIRDGLSDTTIDHTRAVTSRISFEF